jgi:hypothetical protein
MKCPNCNYDNPQGALNCSLCHFNLQENAQQVLEQNEVALREKSLSFWESNNRNSGDIVIN